MSGLPFSFAGLSINLAETEKEVQQRGCVRVAGIWVNENTGGAAFTHTFPQPGSVEKHAAIVEAYVQMFAISVWAFAIVHSPDDRTKLVYAILDGIKETIDQHAMNFMQPTHLFERRHCLRCGKPTETMNTPCKTCGCAICDESVEAHTGMDGAALKDHAFKPKEQS